MAWKEMSLENQRREFVMLAQQEDCNRAILCARFGISRKTGYKWLKRHAQNAGLADQSRRPHSTPKHTDPLVEKGVLDLRALHPAWGGRKLRRRLLDLGQPAPGREHHHRHFAPSFSFERGLRAARTLAAFCARHSQ